jgi:hypothetical protein
MGVSRKAAPHQPALLLDDEETTTMTFDEWRATREGSADIYEVSGYRHYPGFVYQPGWIARLPGGDYLTLAANEDYQTPVLADAESWLWLNYAHYEV